MPEYICPDCGHIFWDCEATVTKVPNFTGVGTEWIATFSCPCCGSEELEEASHCRKCGGAFRESDLIAQYYCKECLEIAITPENVKEFMEDPLTLESFAEWLHEKEEIKRNGTDPLEKAD